MLIARISLKSTICLTPKILTKMEKSPKEELKNELENIKVFSSSSNATKSGENSSCLNEDGGSVNKSCENQECANSSCENVNCINNKCENEQCINNSCE